DAARVNAFYVGNMVHDLTYRYGFTETSYNFQQNNNGLGGAQNDRVQISVQDSSGSNNAVFSTPPDGQSGQMRMYLWTYTSPQGDGALENDIVTHEYGHGVSNRLTGGGTATCLQTTESRGLGEGWSDALADWTEQKSAEERPFTLGSYVYTKNIRTYPYSTDKSVNPRTYATLKGLTAVHSIGEVWALLWHEIYAALIAAHGFTSEKNNTESTAGNVVALHLFIDAMKLQPCNPTFITARNAVIQADANRYNGANKCLLWRAYAKRGLGYVCTPYMNEMSYSKATTARNYKDTNQTEREFLNIPRTYGVKGIDHPLSKRGINASPQEAAKSFLESKLGVDAGNLIRKTGHTDNSTRVANEYFLQQFNGIPVANAVANVAVKDNKVLSFSASFVKATLHRPSQNSQSKMQLRRLTLTGAKYNSFPVGLEYFAKDNDQVVLTHTVQVQNTATMEWYLTYIDASSGEVVNLVDFTAEASYRVIPFTSQDPRDGFQVITNPHDPVSSPNGWHQHGTTKTTDTSGNNVISYASSIAETTTQSSATNNYHYGFDPKVSNMVHDLTYRYGFTESSYNFQQNNNGLRGAQGDRVYIMVQDSLITNNASFSTPPDGQPGVMRTFFWTYTSPRRDGALENDIVTHEYGRGISNRLTGGGTATCLQTTEARGLGEGWSDALAEWTEQTSAKERDFTLGSYVNTQSIRTYPYSTNMTTNPRTYATLKGLGDGDLHSIGEVWALLWHEIYVALIAKYGFTTNKNDPTLAAGNTIALHLFIDGLKLQPCNPTYISARDAVIQADANRYGGVNTCLLWKACAKRGLGYGATTTKVNSMTLPPGC
ncbi:unnamed protein product, partial [Rhizoctonia solani]